MNNPHAQELHEDTKMVFRSIFISDIHLGSFGSQADLLLDFLKRTDSEYLFLVGDIIDGWRLKQRWFWPQSHNDVIQKILRKARKGTKVFFIPGNHDEFARDYAGLVVGQIPVMLTANHTTLKGVRLLVMHGDEFDGVVRYGKWLAHLGSWAYDMTVVLNGRLNSLRRRLGLPYWSLAAYIKRQVKEAVKFITNFEEAVAKHGASENVDGVVCGHIHHPSMKTVNGIVYLNDGDWVENGTALVEDLEGNLEILKWHLDKEPTVICSQIPSK